MSSYFIWDGDQLLLELDGSGNRRADYTYFPGTIDQPAAQSIGATTVTAIRDFRFDGTGSVIGTVQGTGVSQKVAYSQWGGPDFSGNSDNHLMWKGLLYNEDVAGLIYMRNRWYDPAEGRFYNEDPIGHAGGENLYSFNDNDPINGSDPSGMTMALITVWGNMPLYAPEPALDSWGASAEGSSLAAFFAGGGGGGGAGASPTASTVHRQSSVDWPSCADKLGQAALSFALDWVGAKEFVAARAAVGTAEKIVGQASSRLARNGGLFSGHVLRDFRNANAWGQKGLSGFSSFWTGIQERGLQSTTPLEVIPIIGTALLGRDAVRTCSGIN